MNKVIAMLTLVVGCWPVAVRCQQSGASIAGAIRDANGVPILGAVVSCRRVRELRRDKFGHVRAVGQPVSVTANSSLVDGSFLFSNLAAGDYYLCAYGVQPSHIPSCEWIRPAFIVHLEANAQIANLALTVQSGALINILVQDLNSRIGAGAKFYPGIISGWNYFSAARLIRHTPTSYEYWVAIPKTETVRLFLDSSLRVTTESGTPIVNRQPDLVISPQGQATVSVSLIIQ